MIDKKNIDLHLNLRGTDSLNLDRERASQARLARLEGRSRSSTNFDSRSTDRGLVVVDQLSQQSTSPVESPPAPLALSLEGLLAVVQGTTQQQVSDSLGVGALQHESDATRQALSAANEEISRLKEEVPAEVPVVQQLVGEAPDLTLHSREGEVVRVEERMLVRPPEAGAMSEQARALIEEPKLKQDSIKDTTPVKWLDYAAKLAGYYTAGGVRSVSTFWDSSVLQALSETFGMSVSELVSLTSQRQVYQLLKASWTKPEDGTVALLEGVRKVELNPGEKGSMLLLVSLFTSQMRVRAPAGQFTKALLDSVRGQVRTYQWRDEFKTKTYSSYEDFYSHLKELATAYDQSKQQVQQPTSFDPKRSRKKGSGSEDRTRDHGGEKARTQDKSGDRTPSQSVKKCLLCGGEHWAFALGSDYTKDYSDQVKWECPSLDRCGVELRRRAWESRKEQVARRKKAFERKKAGGGAGGVAAAGSAP